MSKAPDTEQQPRSPALGDVYFKPQKLTFSLKSLQNFCFLVRKIPVTGVTGARLPNSMEVDQYVLSAERHVEGTSASRRRRLSRSDCPCLSEGDVPLLWWTGWESSEGGAAPQDNGGATIVGVSVCKTL